jgi:hypothetical protein
LTAIEPAKGVSVGVTPAPPENRKTDRASETPLEVLLLTERRDELAILAEMRGEIADTYVYSFQQGNRTITNLAYPGVKEAVRRRGNIAIVPCDCCKKQYHVEETNEEFRAVVKIHDLVNNVQFLGVSTCKKTIPFAYVVAANKAERNGLRKLLPEKEIALLIKEWAKPASPKQPAQPVAKPPTSPSPTKQPATAPTWTDTS